MFGKKKDEEEVKTDAKPAEETKPAEASASEETPKPAEELAAERAPAEGQTEEKPAGQEASKAPAEPDWKDRYARLLADFDNFKKRTARDREDSYRFAEAEILKDILPTVDNLSLALSKAGDKDDPFVKGVQLVFDTLLKALKDHDAEPFDSVGKELDTEKMEAIATLPSADIDEGKVSNEVKRGWMLKGKVLRAAQVVVSAGAPAEAK